MPLGFEYALTDFESDGSFNSSGGYNVEFRVPVDSMVLTAELGQLVGFELQTDDADAEGGPRLHVTKWWEEGIGRDDSWQHAENWGTAILGSLVQVGVAEKPASVVSRFDLAQNYPNPFNPSTQISYTLKSNSVVRLSVYNLLGQEVSVLVNGNQTAGSHTVVFSGSNLPSGVYFYKLQSANEVLTKKMALLK
jgi:hypothetical protein